MSIPNETWPCSSSANFFLGVKDSVKEAVDGTLESVRTLFDKWGHDHDCGHFSLHCMGWDSRRTPLRSSSLCSPFWKDLNITSPSDIAKLPTCQQISIMICQPLLQTLKVLIPGWTSFRELLGRSFSFVASIKWHTKWEHIEGMVRKRQIVRYNIWRYMIRPISRGRGKKKQRFCPNFHTHVCICQEEIYSKLKTHYHDPFQVGAAISVSHKAHIVLQPISSTIKLLQGNWLLLGQLPIPNALQQMDTLRYNLCTHTLGSKSFWRWRWAFRIFSMEISKGLVCELGEEQCLAKGLEHSATISSSKP